MPNLINIINPPNFILQCAYLCFFLEGETEPHYLSNVIRAFPLVSVFSLLLLNQIRLQILSPFHPLLAVEKLKDSQSLLTLPVSYGAVGTGSCSSVCRASAPK